MNDVIKSTQAVIVSMAECCVRAHVILIGVFKNSSYQKIYRRETVAVCILAFLFIMLKEVNIEFCV